MTASLISVSIVSHAQAGLVLGVLDDLARHCGGEALEVLLTKNLPESLPFDPEDFPFPVTVIENRVPKGFSANHNAAFKMSSGKFFCVVNPDIRLTANPFPSLVSVFGRDVAGLSAPKVVDSKGAVEDSARRLPTPLVLTKKLFKRQRAPDYVIGKERVEPDWVAGMFMLFPSSVFAAVNGFDDRYFLYYEDVDICCRLRLAGYRIVLSPGVTIIHDARRESHRRLGYLRFHLSSMMRFFLSPVFFRCFMLGGRN